MNLRGTRWRRKQDGLQIVIEQDGSRNSYVRDILARSTKNGRTFWISHEGLSRKYEQMT